MFADSMNSLYGRKTSAAAAPGHTSFISGGFAPERICRSRRWQFFIAITTTALLSATAGLEAEPTSSDVFPGTDWQEATPESQGVNSGKLKEAVELLAGTVGKDRARELVVIRHGRMIGKGDDIDKRHGVWSCTKSFTSTVFGLLIEDGRCTLGTRVADVLLEFKPHYPDVTLRHFTTMTSGYRAVGDETTGSYRHGPSKTPFTPNPKPLFTPAGSQFAYWDSAMNTFGLALTKIAGKPMEELFRRRVAEPIGMKDWDWGDYATADGVVVNGGSGNGGKHIFITARDMARFGLLFLHQGNWNGRQLISREWIDEATRVQVPATMPWAHPESEIDGRGCYGFNWWRNGLKADGTRKFPGAPENMFWASGHNNNKCFVIPEWDMVIVRLGLDGEAKDEVWNGFLGKVGEAVDSTGKPKATAPPYPSGEIIERVEFDWGTHRREAPGSDNWPMTWAADGHQYTAWGDGGGFGGDNKKGRVTLGVARIEGGAENYMGRNVWGGFEPERPATFGGKSYGILSVAGRLYLWVVPQPGPHLKECRLASSTDLGRTWTQADWAFRFEDGLSIPTFLNFGRNHAGAPDQCVYSYYIEPQWGPATPTGSEYGFEVHKPGRIHLSRAPGDLLMRREAHEFFAGLDRGGNPKWSRILADKQPVFEDSNGVGWNVSVSYNAGLRRYLLATEHGNTHAGRFGLFDAPEPWGPWTTVAHEDAFGAGHVEVSTFFWSFPNKWVNADGTHFTMVFTGKNSNDSWNTVDGRFVLRASP